MTRRDKFAKCFFIIVSYAFSGSKNYVQYFYTNALNNVISHYMLQSNERNSYENTEYMPSQTECNTNKFERYYIEMKMTEIMNKRKYE
jgi:hypothetical protein